MSPAQMEQIRRFAEEVASREGCKLYDLEFSEGPDRCLRVFIDKESGVSLDDCVNVSKGLNLRLGVEDVVPGGKYELEVSSPGLERKLTLKWHFEGAVGQMVRLKCRPSEDGQLAYEGRLVSVEGEKLWIENSKGRVDVDLDRVERAKVILGDVFQKKPPPGKKKR